MKRVIKTAVAVAAFGLAAGICAPAQAQTYDASDLINGLGGSSPMAGLGTGIIDLGMNQSSFAGGQFVGGPYGQFAGGQGIVSFGGQGLGFRRAQNVSVDSHYMPWAPMERLVCASGDNPAYGGPAVSPMAGPVPVVPSGPESLVAGPGGPVIPTPEFGETVQPSVAEAAALAGQQPEAALVDVAQQPAPPVDVAAPQQVAPPVDASAPQQTTEQTAEQAAAAAQQAAAQAGAPAQQADPAPQQAAEQAGAPAPQMGAPAPQEAAQAPQQAEAATVTSATQPVVDSAAEVLAPVSDAVAEGATAAVGTPVAGASMDSTQLIAAS
ncbi:hypothetical protein [Streptosporangium subroseum]|uniref:hypothetical protein n=1 Tax=Streptosporangium subroseum TaxID=106412 RepID=UPI0030905DFE|nr:hypothetical protein OHB15_01015 [Streptosporangium subroseum]